jgi:hypothetical protein
MGQKIAAYDATGKVYAFFDSVESPVPKSVTTNTLNVTDAQWMAIQTTPGYSVKDGALVEPQPPSADALLAAAQEVQIAKNNSACAAVIVAGFVSNALGAAHTYPCALTDQHNLASAVYASLMPGIAADWVTPLKCANGNDWGYVEHTAAQVQKVAQDGKSAITAQLTHNDALRKQVMAATQIADVQAVK